MAQDEEADAGPRASSSAAPPNAGPRASSSAAPPTPARGPRLAGQRVHSSPTELLGQLCPPNARLTINQNDTRFVMTFSCTHEYWIDDFAYKTRSRRFNKDDWQARLAEVHTWAWQKWDLTREAMPLEADRLEQSPGEVPPELLQEVGAVVREVLEKTGVAAAGIRSLVSLWGHHITLTRNSRPLKPQPFRLWHSNQCLELKNIPKHSKTFKIIPNQQEVPLLRSIHDRMIDLGV